MYHGTDCEETEKAARGMSSSRVQYVSPYNDLDVIAGPEIQKNFQNCKSLGKTIDYAKMKECRMIGPCLQALALSCTATVLST